jgi:hypothetical protein
MEGEGGWRLIQLEQNYHGLFVSVSRRCVMVARRKEIKHLVRNRMLVA